MQPLLSIIIASRNTKTLLKETLKSLYQNLSCPNFEVIVVDDCSSDRSPEMIKKFFPKVLLLQNKTNLGYSKSYNKGTKTSKGRYILHLNSDCRLLKKTDFTAAIKRLEKEKKIGIIGAKILKEDGRLDLPCKRKFPTPQNIFLQSCGLAFLFPNHKKCGEYYLTYLNEDKETEVDCLMGAFMLIKQEVFEDIGYIDERFFIYGEDIDFCYRAKKAGWKILYYPEIVVGHLHGGTAGKHKIKSLWLFHKAMKQYYDKHYAKRKKLLFNLSINTGIYLRFFLCILLIPLFPVSAKLTRFSLKINN